jgi:hypothetical protein
MDQGGPNEVEKLAGLKTLRVRHLAGASVLEGGGTCEGGRRGNGRRVIGQSREYAHPTSPMRVAHYRHRIVGNNVFPLSAAAGAGQCKAGLASRPPT